MPKGSKRKREDEGEGDPPPRRSERQRKRVSFGEEFIEQWSPPRGVASTSSAPDPDPFDPNKEPLSPEDTVTWPSSPEYYGKELPRNHCKHL